MRFIKIPTKIINPPKDDIYNVIDEFVPVLKEGDVLLITSKVLAIHQGRCVKIGSIDKDELIAQEAEKYIPRQKPPHDQVMLTIKENTLIPSAGIDESNSDGYYVLWPKNSSKLAREICNYLKKKNKIKKLAVIITDSHCVPLRRGTVGIAIGFYGLKPLEDYRGQKDIFNRKIEISQANIVDALAAMGVLLMGEGSEKTPMVVVRGADFIEFTDKDCYKKFIIDEEEDIYYPLLKTFE